MNLCFVLFGFFFSINVLTGTLDWSASISLGRFFLTYYFTNATCLNGREFKIRFMLLYMIIDIEIQTPFELKV